jgi:hypothetical protein
VRRRALIRRATPLRRKRPLNRLPSFDEDYYAKRPILLREGCRLCPAAAAHVHHRKMRSQGGDNDWPNLVPLCWWHHDAVHRYPAIAHTLGLIVRRGEDPVRIPILSLRELPAWARLRMTRPVYDWKLAQRLVDAEHARLGPDLESVPDHTEGWI